MEPNLEFIREFRLQIFDFLVRILYAKNEGDELIENAGQQIRPSGKYLL